MSSSITDRAIEAAHVARQCVLDMAMELSRTRGRVADLEYALARANEAIANRDAQIDRLEADAKRAA